MDRRALITDYAWPSLDPERRILGEMGVDLLLPTTGEEDELVELAADADAILTNWKPVTARVLEHAPRCVTVARYGVGIDNIDVSAATELGILVSNVPDYCIDEVSEHAMALLLALGRRIVEFGGQTRAGGWDNQGAGAIHRFRGRTLGLVGFGRIAQAVAEKALAFGMVVLAYGPRLTPGVHDGVESVASLDELLVRSDAVSLHVPLTDSTRHLIGARQLALMGPGSFLINTARGALIDDRALAEALSAGAIGGAGLDVMDDEPAPPDHPLRHSPGVIMTPHAAFFSLESVAEVQEKAAANVVSVLNGHVPETTVNRAVLDRANLRMNPGG